MTNLSPLLSSLRFAADRDARRRRHQAAGVSLRSLYCNIDSLHDVGAQIEGERGFGYSLMEDCALPPQTFNRMEVKALALGLTEAVHMGDTVLAEAVTALLRQSCSDAAR